MPTPTPRLGIQKPTGNENVTRQSTNDNYDIIDENAATKAEFNNHQTAAVIDHPDNSVTDAKIGDRTADPTLVPTGLIGSLTSWISWITNRIKAITGKTNWHDAPDTTLAAANTHMLDNVKHVTQADKDNWNGKQDALGFTPVNVTTYNTQVNQDVRTTASPSFAGLSLSGTSLAQTRVNNGNLEYLNGGVWKRVSAPMKSYQADVSETHAPNEFRDWRTLFTATGAGKITSLGFTHTGSVGGSELMYNYEFWLDGAIWSSLTGSWAYGQEHLVGINDSSADDAELYFTSSFELKIKTQNEAGQTNTLTAYATWHLEV